MNPRPDPTFLPTKLGEIQARLNEVNRELAEHEERVAALNRERVRLEDAVKVLKPVVKRK